MSSPATSSPTFFGDVTLGSAGGQAWSDPIQACRRISFINATTVPITVVQRSGLPVTIPPKTTFRSRDFVIRTEFQFTPEVKENVRAVLDGVDDSSSIVLQKLKQALKESDEKLGLYARANLVLDHPITLEQLQAHGRSVYHHETDCVVSMLPIAYVPAHPHSEEGRSLKMMAETPVKVGGESFGYCVEIVDNTGRFGDRFINIANQVYRVRTKRDPERRDGIYIGSSDPDAGELFTGSYSVNRIPLDSPDHEKFGIYRTFEDARHLGDLTQAQKMSLASVEYATAQVKKELEQTKQQYAKEMAELEHQLKLSEAREKEADLRRARREAELDEERKRAEHLLALERLRLKDRYEERSQDRKDRSEMVKMLPTIIVGIGAAIPIIMKLMKPNG
jgi:hypothetical protein